MKAIGIIGYKNSGKTTLAASLCTELLNRGLTVVMIKHADSSLMPAGVDSTKLIECSGQGAVISDSETVLSFKGGLPLERVLTLFRGDMAIVEGFKDEKTYPRIVCLRDEAEAKNLFDGLQIGVVGSGEDLAVPLLTNIKEIADIVLEKAFKLPGLECGACGFETCYELAQAIVVGDRAEKDCVSLHPKAVVRIDDEVVPINPFISDMIGGTVKGLISTLKGVREGKIEIEISP
jgi:molybdopterin-guanine dinucleotide biosynthesis protein B